MLIKKGILKDFDAENYTATIQISGSSKAYLEGIAVSRSIPPAEMVPGRQAAVIFWDQSNPSDGVIVAIY